MYSCIYLSKLFTNALYWLFYLSVKIGTLITIPFDFIYCLVMCLRFFKSKGLIDEVFSLLEAVLVLLEYCFETSFSAL